MLGRTGNRHRRNERARRGVWGELDTILRSLSELRLARRADAEDDRRHYATCPVCSGPEALTIIEPTRYSPVQISCGNGCDARKVRAAFGLLPDAELARQLQREPASLSVAEPRRGNGNGPSNVGARSVSTGEEPWPALSVARPPFPLDALPSDVRRFVDAVAEETQTPVDLAAVTALGVVSIAANGPLEVDCGTWRERCLGLWTLTALDTGEHKSAVLNAVAEPLLTIEDELRTRSARSRRERRRKREILLERQGKLTKAAAGARDPDEREQAEAEVFRVDAELEELGELAEPRLLANDTTPEMLGTLLAEHGRIGIVAAEAPFLDNLLGRYDPKKGDKGGGAGANLHLACSAYSGEPTHIDRRRGSEALPRPLLAVTLAPQPHVLDAVVCHPLARKQGFVGRHLFALPGSRQGFRRIEGVQLVSEDVKQGWEHAVRRVASQNPLTVLTEHGDLRLTVSTVSASLKKCSDSLLLLSPEARVLLTQLRKRVEPRLREDGDLYPIRDWMARFAGNQAKIAALLHLLEGGTVAEPISGAIMGRALALGEYFLGHALLVLTVQSQPWRRALSWLSRWDESTVTQRQLQRGPLNGRGTADDARQLAQELVAFGALRPLDVARTGPPSPAWAINPCVQGATPSQRDLWWDAVAADGEPYFAENEPSAEDLAAVLSVSGAAH
jgi:hypothetical protein